jgi:hypothetical protein
MTHNHWPPSANNMRVKHKPSTDHPPTTTTTTTITTTTITTTTITTTTITTTTSSRSRLGGVVVSVLAAGPKGHRLKPGWGDGFLGAIKICSTPYFGWELKPEVPCRKILRHVKDPLRYIRYWEAKFSLLRPFLLLAPDSAGKTAIELWWMSQELFPASIIITMALHAHISPGGWWPQLWDIVLPHHNNQSINQPPPMYHYNARLL